MAIILLIVAFFAGWFSHQNFAYSFIPGSQSQTYEGLFQQAWNDIDQNYVDRKAVDYRQMSYQAIRAIVDVLHDTGHTRFLTPADVQAENQELSGTFTGIGIYLRQDQTTKQLVITATIPGSPAEKAGFKRGDILLAVNGTSIVGEDVDTVTPIIQGKAGTSVSVTVKRPSTQQTLTITVLRAEITVPNVIWHYIPQDHIAHIQIVQFSSGASDQLKKALIQAKQMGATSFILDMRDDPGGYLQEAINTASEFMASGNVLLEQDSKGVRTPYMVNGATVNTTSPIVVLVNNNTASAAEIVSGALQDNHRAYIIGVKTFGTGTVLEEFPLSDGSALLLGTREWLTPDGHFIRNQGITPNMTVTLNANVIPLEPNDENVGHLTEQQILSSGDTQLAAAIHYLETHSTTSTGPAQSESLQQQISAAGQLALEPAFFPAEA
jgi:carboxyl-terminal processing protease